MFSATDWSILQQKTVTILTNVILYNILEGKLTIIRNITKRKVPVSTLMRGTSLEVLL